MSNQNPFDEYMRRIQTSVRTTRGGFPGGKPPPGFAGAVAGLALLVGGSLFFSNALFNVDGGHRAIKYKRITGVGKEIYAEGESGHPDAPA